jgi:hypothetical protein
MDEKPCLRLGIDARNEKFAGVKGGSKAEFPRYSKDLPANFPPNFGDSNNSQKRIFLDTQAKKKKNQTLAKQQINQQNKKATQKPEPPETTQ